MMRRADTANVIAPPPLIALAAVIAGLGFDRLRPLGVVALIPAYPRYAIAVLLLTLAVIISLHATRSFARAGTTVKPWRSSSALVTTGIFSHTRNPMYGGLGLLVVAIAFGLTSDWTFIALIICAFVIHYGVVLREERYLEKKFGGDYRRYKAEVPRYGWKF